MFMPSAQTRSVISQKKRHWWLLRKKKHTGQTWLQHPHGVAGGSVWDGVMCSGELSRKKRGDEAEKPWTLNEPPFPAPLSLSAELMTHSWNRGNLGGRIAKSENWPQQRHYCSSCAEQPWMVAQVLATVNDNDNRIGCRQMEVEALSASIYCEPNIGDCVWTFIDSLLKDISALAVMCRWWWWFTRFC